VRKQRTGNIYLAANPLRRLLIHTMFSQYLAQDGKDSFQPRGCRHGLCVDDAKQVRVALEGKLDVLKLGFQFVLAHRIGAAINRLCTKPVKSNHQPFPGPQQQSVVSRPRVVPKISLLSRYELFFTFGVQSWLQSSRFPKRSHRSEVASLGMKSQVCTRTNKGNQ